MSPAAHEQTPEPLTFAAWAASTLVRWRTVMRTALLALVAALVSTLVVPAKYESSTSFVANTSGGGIKLPAGLSSVAGLSGLASSLGSSGMGGDPSESPAFYVELLDSRELLTRLVLQKYHDPRSSSPADSANLIALFKIKKKDPTRALELAIKSANDAIDASADVRTNLVTVTVDAEWPELSAAIANRAAELVSEFNQQQRVSRARAKREFVEGRLAASRTELATAEGRLRNFIDANRGLRTAPDLLIAEQQIRRQVDVAQDMYLTLRREFETSRLTEVNDAPLITLVDRAVQPRKALWPRYGVLVVAALFAGTMIGVMLAAASALLSSWAARNPADAARLAGAVRSVRADVWPRRRRRGADAAATEPSAERKASLSTAAVGEP